MRSLFNIGRKTHPEAEGPLPVTEYLGSLEMFRDLPGGDLEHFAHTLVMRECSPGTVFFSPEDTSERLFILKSGQVDLYHLSNDGRRMVLARLKPITIFGEMGLLGQTMHGCYAESVSPSLVCIGARGHVMQVLQQHPDIALRLLEAVGRRLKAVEERLAILALGSVRSRLSALLLTQMNPDTQAVSGFIHAELGEMIGASRQTVTETLATLHRDGVVEVGHKYVHVLDEARLRDIARGRE